MPTYTRPIAFLIGGIVVTIGTFLFAEPGGTYVVAWGAIVWGLWALYSTWQARRAWFALMRQDYTLAELETVAAALQAQAEADAKGSEEIAKAEEAARREAERKAEREAQPPPTTPLGKLTRWIG